jgi:predicted aminopeptidase
MAILISNYGFADLLSLRWHVFLAPFSAWLFCLCSLARLDILAAYARLVCCLCVLASYALCLGTIAVFYARWLAILPGCLAILSG